MATHKPFIRLFSRLAASKDNVVLAPQISYLSFLLIIPQSPMSSVFLFVARKKLWAFLAHSFFIYFFYLFVYMNNAKREAPATVMMPAATMAREDMAPSTAPISMALEVPMA